MRCPYCDNDSQVVDSRTTAEGVRRRRVCKDCRRRFTTYERVGSPDIKVVKRSGKTEPFDYEKLVNVLTLDAMDNISKEPDYKKCAVQIEAVRV